MNRQVDQPNTEDFRCRATRLLLLMAWRVASGAENVAYVNTVSAPWTRNQTTKVPGYEKVSLHINKLPLITYYASRKYTNYELTLDVGHKCSDLEKSQTRRRHF